METQQIKLEVKDFFNSNIFKKIENKVVGEAVSEATNTVRRELELFKFEVLYPQIVSKKERDEIETEVTKIRDKKWQEALKKAGGDEEKALMLI